MEITYRNATLEDLDFLVQSRMDFIDAKPEEPGSSQIREHIRRYFEETLPRGGCEVVLAQAADQIIGTGIVFYYDSVPSAFNPQGKNAYITSVYVGRTTAARVLPAAYWTA